MYPGKVCKVKDLILDFSESVYQSNNKYSVITLFINFWTIFGQNFFFFWLASTRIGILNDSGLK